MFAYKMVFSPAVEKIIVFANKTFTYRSVKFRYSDNISLFNSGRN